MFGKKRQKNYQNMLKARKNKDYDDLYDDYFEGDETEDDIYGEEDLYEEQHGEEQEAFDGDGGKPVEGEYEDAPERYEYEEKAVEDEEDDSEEAFEDDYEDKKEPVEVDDDFDIPGEEGDDFDYASVPGREDEIYTAESSVQYMKPSRKMMAKKLKEKKAAQRVNTARRKKINGTDLVIAVMGICIMAVSLITAMLYADARMLATQVAAFEKVGAGFDDIHIVGESGLLAVGAAQEEKMYADFEELPGEGSEEPALEEPEDEDAVVDVALKVTSIQSDIKVKFVNKTSEKIIGGVPFKVHIKGNNGKEFDLQDDDKDGVIYRTEVPNGTYKVSVEALSGDDAERYKLPTEAVSIKVTDTIAYKKVDVKEEIKNESQVNAAMEDTAAQNTAVESTLQDTVEWVESTKTPIEGEPVYEEVKDNEIEKPAAAWAAVANHYTMAFLGTENSTGYTTFEEENETPVMSAGLFDAEIEEGGTIQFSASMSDGSAVSWSSDSDCASVDQSGLVTGKRAGTATITAKSEVTGYTESCTVTVKEKKEEEPVPPSEPTIRLEQSSASVKVGSTVTLRAIVENNNDNKAVEWKSSDTAIAKVSDGTVTGVAKGTAVITAVLQGTEISASCTVEVTKEETKPDAKGISLDADEVSLTVGAEVTLKATTENPKDEVVWSTSDKKIVTVKSGKIKGLKVGTATITAALKSDSSVNASCIVTVTAGDIDTTAALRDTKGNRLYVKKGDGGYREATVADYLKGGYKFYRKTNKTTGYRYTGWQTIDGYTYFYDKNGNYVTGEQVIQGAKYTFDADGKLSASSGTMGIDVSKWNGDINWSAVKNSGVSFVIIRCGYRGSSTGALIEDPKFRANIKGAKAAGLSVGVYFFTQAINEVEAVEEASMALSLIGGYGVNMPVYLDVESSGGRADRIDANARTAVCKAFCATIQNSGYKAGIYANKTWLTSYIHTSSLTGYKIWLAQYAAAPTYTATRYDMWQYSSKGRVSGISGNVDMNIRYN